MKSTRQCLRCLREGVVAGRSSDHEPTRCAVPVEFGLDRIEDERHVLILVNAHWRRSGDENSGIGRNGVACLKIIEVDDVSIVRRCQGTQQGGLAHRAWALKREHRFVG
jgi:hypothetical protein